MSTLVVLGIGVVVWIALLRRYGGAGAGVELETIRTAGTLLIGTGGAVALLLAARRQRATELTLVHTDRDATERRITELYTKAADQLGSNQAPVRLAGLYALERLANSTAEHRQTIVNVICAYLRMPYTPPPDRPSPRNGAYRSPGPRQRRPRSLTDPPPTSPLPRHQQTREERQVRLTAQDILARNLRVPQADRRRWWQWKQTPEAAPPWPRIRLDLTGALLIDFTLAYCQLDKADFTGAQFIGGAGFTGTQFIGDADFCAQFIGGAYFGGAQFTRGARFTGVRFSHGAYFFDAQFTDKASFFGAQFIGDADFRDTKFTGDADFIYSEFNRGVRFTGARFSHGAYFFDAQFTGNAHFPDTQFIGKAHFGGARVALDARIPGWTVRTARPDEGEDPGYQYLVRVEDAEIA